MRPLQSIYELPFKRYIIFGAFGGPLLWIVLIRLHLSCALPTELQSCNLKSLMSSRYECQSAFLIIDSHHIDFFVVQIILPEYSLAISVLLPLPRCCSKQECVLLSGYKLWGFCPLIVLEFPAWWFVCNVLTSFGCLSVNCFSVNWPYIISDFHVRGSGHLLFSTTWDLAIFVYWKLHWCIAKLVS